jgi:hypothetical protein
MINPHFEKFLSSLKSLIGDKSLVKLVISNPRHRKSELKSLIITLVELKKGLRLNMVYRYPTKDITKNLSIEQGLLYISESLTSDFANADLFAVRETIQLSVSKKGVMKLSSHPNNVQIPPSLIHDRVKERLIEHPGNLYLRELGILNANFELRRDMSDKYLQINRYIELLGPFFRELPLTDGFQVVDMGSGKGYLTFALYDYLTSTLGKSPMVTGVESRDELVILSNEIAVKAGFANLKFISGMIHDVPLGKTDVLIALHACDTATDDAIYRGITAGASLIVCAPCCHKQVRREFHVTNVLRNITKHGILEERQAEIVTDGIRALILEAFGYKTKVFEFISTGHTPKNVMIVGRKIRGKTFDPKQLEKIQEIKTFYGVQHHYLEDLMFG